MIHGNLVAGASPTSLGRPSLLGRMFGMGSTGNGSTRGTGDRANREEPIGDLGEKIRKSLRKFLQERIREPWAASKTAFSFIDMSHNTYVRAEDPVDGKVSAWYVQIMFSGCSGMAEVSAELASHWASIWFVEQRDEIVREFLAPFGFEANSEKDPWMDDLRFLPVGELGYAKFIPQGEINESVGKAPRFEIDCSMSESFSESELEKFLAELDSKFADYFSDGRCCCQICSPDLNAEQIASSIAKFPR